MTLEEKRKKNREYQREWRKTPAGQAYAARANARLKEKRRANPNIQRSTKFKIRYGISIEEYDEMLASQKGVCAVCLRSGHTKHPLHVDHCHTTGRVRGLLCALCNVALGALGDEPQRIMALADYIETRRP